MRKLLWLMVSILFVYGACFAQTVYDDNYTENPNYLKGLEYLENAQYSSAINEFKKAVRTNPLDDSALIGLSNAYNLRAKYYNDGVKETDKAISDIKSALFFNKYFRQNNPSNNTNQAVIQMEKNLRMLELATKQSMAPSDIIKNARSERIKGEFAAAGYDYFRLTTHNEYKAEANSALGDIYKIFNRPEKSIIFYQNALSVNPDDTEIHLKLARVYEDVNDFNSSLKEYSVALDTSNEREDILNSLEKIWQKRVDENPNDAEAHANLGVVYQKEKRYSEALNEYKKAEALNHSNINTKMNIAALYQEQKSYEQALNVYNVILQAQPNNVNALLYKAECLKELKKTNDAVEAYKAVLKADPKNAVAKTEMFSLVKDNMSSEDILTFLYQNVQENPKNASTYYEFAYELHKAGKINDAITYYTQTIKMDSSNIDAYINLAQCYRQQKKYNEAYSVIKKANEIAPDNKLVKNQMNAIESDYLVSTYNDATNAYEAGNYEKAIDLYLKVKPQTKESVLGIAAAYQALGNNDKAIENYNLAMSIDNADANIPYYIAAIYANSNDLEKAEQFTKIALNKNPMHSQAKELDAYIVSKKSEGLLEQAVKFYEDENYNDAITLFGKIISVNPKDSTLYYYRALSYDALKNYQYAINDYLEAVKLSPQLNISYYSIAVDYDNLGNYKAATEYYQKYINLIADDNEYKQYALSRLKELSK